MNKMTWGNTYKKMKKKMNVTNKALNLRPIDNISCSSASILAQEEPQGAFIVYCNAAVVPKHRLLIYRRSTQCTAPQVKTDLTLLQYCRRCSSWCRDGNMTTAMYHNAVAADYERIFRVETTYAACSNPVE